MGLDANQRALLNSLASAPVFAGVLDLVPMPAELVEVFTDEGCRMVRLTDRGRERSRERTP